MQGGGLFERRGYDPQLLLDCAVVQCFILFDVHVLMLNAAEAKYLAKEDLFC